jgi:hypothetical protein
MMEFPKVVMPTGGNKLKTLICYAPRKLGSNYQLAAGQSLTHI